MYAVISDIHGNLEALEAVLRDIPEEVRIVYCLGDVIGDGANPDECCDIVREPDEYIINLASAEDNLEILRSEYPGVPICFFGHTHVKTVTPSPNGSVIEAHTLDLSANGPYLVNPGSVGQPRDGDTFASYVLVEGERVTYRFVEYDIGRAQAKIRSASLPGVLADRLAVGR